MGDPEKWLGCGRRASPCGRKLCRAVKIRDAKGPEPESGEQWWGQWRPREREAPAKEPALMAGTLFSSLLMSSAQHRQLDRCLMCDLQSDSVWS